MKAVRAVFAAMIIFFCCAAIASASPVTATGQGATERDALHAAMRQAIEQKIGVLVDSRTYIENYRVINDQIYMHTEGYIAGYEELQKGYANGIWSVTIRADVKDQLLSADLMTKLQKQAVIRANMQDPRIGVIIMNDDGSENAALENTIITALNQNGFSRMVDLTQIEASVKNRISDAVFEGDYALAQMLKSQFNVDYLVTGLVDINSDGIPLIEEFPFVGSLNNVVVNVSIRMLNANTGEILYAGSSDGQAFNISSKAENEAMKKATKKIVKELSVSALRKAANPEQHVTVLITNGALGSMGEAYGRISKIPGVNKIYTRSTQYGNMQMDVDYNGTAYDLAQALERDGVSIREMNSEYIRI